MRSGSIYTNYVCHSGIPLSVAPPTDGDVGVAKEGEAVGVYDNIPGDQ